MKVRSINMNEK